MHEVEIKTEFIKVSQLLKLANVISQGSDVRILLDEGLIKHNGNIISERGKKIYRGDVVEVLKSEYTPNEKIKVI